MNCERKLSAAGQLRSEYEATSRAFYRGTVAALLVYDITNRDSFDVIEAWLNEMRQHCEESTVKILVGNKCDLAEEARQVSIEEGTGLAERLGSSFMETSALDATNVEQCFRTVLYGGIMQLPNRPCNTAGNAAAIAEGNSYGGGGDVGNGDS